MLRPTLAAAAALSAWLCAPCIAADLLPQQLGPEDLAPAAFDAPPPYPPAYEEDVAVRRRLLPPPPPPLESRVVVTSPLSVGGPYVAIPGLNGPTGPSAYPLLPYAFGYGY